MKLNKLKPRNKPNVPPNEDTKSEVVVFGFWDIFVYLKVGK
jgi:hypothetical protein